MGKLEGFWTMCDKCQGRGCGDCAGKGTVWIVEDVATPPVLAATIVCFVVAIVVLVIVYTVHR